MSHLTLDAPRRRKRVAAASAHKRFMYVEHDYRLLCIMIVTNNSCLFLLCTIDTLLPVLSFACHRSVQCDRAELYTKKRA